jgi:UDP-N-acetylmuramoyl-L-alanyl-D-glutamate--2,6-diaminopimelate ligase
MITVMNMLKKLIRSIVPTNLVGLLEKTYRWCRGYFWQARYGFPARGMRVIAVTGTNGKTTTCSYINEVIKAGGYKTAVFTTAFSEIRGAYEASHTTYTLEKQSFAQRFFSQAKNAGVDWVILEVTSHALDQGRIMGVPVELAVVTNLSQEHLDYHKTMQKYALAKSRLLTDYGAQHAVLNADDKWFEFFRDSSSAEVFSFGKKKGSDAHLTSVKFTRKESTATIVHDRKSVRFATKLLGEFNIYNASAAVSIGLLLGIDRRRIAEGVLALEQVDGRMERIDEGQDFTVLVDFAVTPDAIQKGLESLQKISNGKVRIVFGATGDRDKAKRPLMGQIAAEYADLIYLTDDETYTEDPKAIREAVYEGIKQAKGEKKTTIIADREKAIAQALKDAKKGDVVLLTGMGPEDSRNLGGKLTPWDEREVAKKLLLKSRESH